MKIEISDLTADTDKIGHREVRVDGVKRSGLHVMVTRVQGDTSKVYLDDVLVTERVEVWVNNTMFAVSDPALSDPPLERPGA